VRRLAFTLAAVFLTVSAVTFQAQEPQPATPLSIPAASRSQAYCTGFISGTPIPRDLFVIGGGDDDFHSVARQFVQGESVFISKNGSEDPAIGAEYDVVRPANKLFETAHYSGQGADIRRLGRPYEDVAEVRVTHVTPQGAVAKVTFSCAAIVPGDVLVPFQPRVIPEYTVSAPLDHFAPLDESKHHGRIVGTHNNFGFFGRQTAVYLDLGDADGAQPGKRFRIYKILPPAVTGVAERRPTPPETIGEVVVLSVHSRSSVAMVVASYREIAAGDYVEEE
jgi:hypothetical protein